MRSTAHDTHTVHPQALQRLHVYYTSNHRYYDGQFWKAALSSLQRTPLRHVGLLGHSWGHSKAQEVLSTLPDTLAGVSLGHACQAHLKLGQDENGRVGAQGCDMRREACAFSAGMCGVVQ